MDPVLLIGSGMSGAAVAGELRRRGVPALVADRGRLLGTDHVAADAATAAFIEPERDPCFEPLQRDPSVWHYGRSAGARVRVGGRSLYWRGIALRIEPAALADWPAPVVSALGGPDGWYARVESHVTAWTGAPLDAPRNPTEAHLTAVLRTRGFQDARPTPRAVRPLGSGRWCAYSPLEEIDASAVLTGRTLIGVQDGPDGLDVVLRHGRDEQRVRAAALVLCAGAIENARLVSQLTGRLTPCPITDHLVRGWIRVSDDLADAYDLSDEASVFVLHDAAGRFNAFLELHRIGGHLVMDAWTMGEQRPGPAATVRFHGPDATPLFAIAETPEDEHVLAAETRSLASLCEGLGLAHAISEASQRAAGDFSAALDRAISTPGTIFPYRCPLGSIDHEACTLPLDGDVVDAAGELRGMPRVFVAGPCVFPRPGAANPSLTTMALGRHLAAHVHARLDLASTGDRKMRAHAS